MTSEPGQDFFEGRFSEGTDGSELGQLFAACEVEAASHSSFAQADYCEDRWARPDPVEVVSRQQSPTAVCFLFC